jgi:hypothetical protein
MELGNDKSAVERVSAISIAGLFLDNNPESTLTKNALKWGAVGAPLRVTKLPKP